MKQKENGRIRHLGFSAHGSVEVIRRFLDAYGANMDFCQLQLNYMDWHFQGAKEKVELVQSAGLPIWVMEPLRGGRLAKATYDMAEELLRMECVCRRLQKKRIFPDQQYRIRFKY